MQKRKLFLIVPLVLMLMLAACAPGDTDATPDPFGTPLTTPDTALTPGLGTTPDTALTPDLTPDIALTPEATPDVALTPETTPDTALTPMTTPDTALTPETTPDVALTPETTPGVVGTQPVVGTPGTPVGEAERSVILASDLIGSVVVDENMEEMGDVREVLVDEQGDIQFVVLDLETYLMTTGPGAVGTPGAVTTPGVGETTPGAVTTPGVGEATPGAVTTPGLVGEARNLAAIPFDQFELNTNPDVDTGLLAGTPVLIFSGDTTMLQDHMVFGENLLDLDGYMLDTTADMPEGTTIPQQFDGMIRLSRYGNIEVIDGQNQELGTVSDVVVDVQQGMAQYGVLDIGGFLGIGAQTVAVPWERFTMAPAADAAAQPAFQLNVTEDTLRNAPEINLNDIPAWPEPVQQNWDVETQTYWDTAA